jgi:hypothetical protein
LEETQIPLHATGVPDVRHAFFFVLGIEARDRGNAATARAAADWPAGLVASPPDQRVA